MPEPESKLERQALISQCKRKAFEDICEKQSKIICREIEPIDTGSVYLFFYLFLENNKGMSLPAPKFTRGPVYL